MVVVSQQSGLLPGYELKLNSYDLGVPAPRRRSSAPGRTSGCSRPPRMEDASEHSGLTFIAAVNGSCAGGGYELALACDRIQLIDDNSSAVTLPEVPLLDVLPGTGGPTRLTDKRRVRKDLADVNPQGRGAVSTCGSAAGRYQPRRRRRRKTTHRRTTRGATGPRVPPSAAAPADSIRHACDGTAP